MKQIFSPCHYGLKKPLSEFICLSVAFLLLLASCTKTEVDPKIASIKPKGPKPAWGPTITPQMQTVIEKLESYGTPPLYTLTPEQARKAPTPANAAMDVMKDYNIAPPPFNVDTMGKDIPVDEGQIHLRIYTPKTGKTVYPVIVYYHGGGWVIGSPDVYNASTQALSEKANAIVVSVVYRKAPEYKFPTAHNDSYAAYDWVVRNASSIKGDPNRIAVAGESAGGNLAAAVSMMARDKGNKIPVHELLVYPIANYDFNTPSYQMYADAKPLSRPLMQWFFGHYLQNPAQGNDTRISLVKANLKMMPSTTIIAAEIDPLLSEGMLLADKLREASVAVTYKKYIGVTHEFFGMASVIPEAIYAQELAVKELKKAFNR
ncbi:MAG: alpha/beta hydrolase [Chitinophagaceae bacterium]